MSGPLQIEFPLRVAVCAWCKPKERRAELGTNLGAISHGICPRHFKKLKHDLQKQLAAKPAAPAPPATSRRRRTVASHPEPGHPA